MGCIASCRYVVMPFSMKGGRPRTGLPELDRAHYVAAMSTEEPRGLLDSIPSNDLAVVKGSRWGHCWSTFLRTLYFGARHPWFEGKGARTWTGSLRTSKPESMIRSMVLRPWDRRLAQWLRSKTARHSRFLLVSAWCAGVRRPSKRREEVPEMLRSRHGCLLGQGLVRGERSIWGASRCRHDLIQEPSAVPSRDVMPSSRQ